MTQVHQDLEGLGDNPVGLAALDVGNNAHAATVMFVVGRVQAVLGQVP